MDLKVLGQMEIIGETVLGIIREVVYKGLKHGMAQ